MSHRIMCVVITLVTAVTSAPVQRNSLCDFGVNSFDKIDIPFNIDFDNLYETAIIDTLPDFHRAFNYAGYVDGKYTVYIPLAGYNYKEINVEASGNVVFVEALHRMMWSYTDYYFEIFVIPDGINTQGTWEYKDGILLLEFPLIPDSKPDITDISPTWRNVETTTIELVPSVSDVTEVQTFDEVTPAAEKTETTEIIPTTSTATTTEEVKPKEHDVEAITLTIHEDTTTAVVPTSTTDSNVEDSDETKSKTDPASEGQPRILPTDDDNNIYITPPEYEDSAPRGAATVNKNEHPDFYATSSIPLPDNSVTEVIEIYTQNPEVFWNPRIKNNELVEEKHEAIIDPKSQYELVDIE